MDKAFLSDSQQYRSNDLLHLRPLAEGTTSMLEVGLLQDVEVAVKSLKPVSLLAEAQARARVEEDFENEFRINVRLNHPNVVQLLGHIRSESSKLHSLIFEYCESGRLRCAHFGPRRISEGLAVCKGIANALSYAHSCCVVHRDVKPSQVLLGNDRVPKLADWGLATFCENGFCNTGETGTWEFMAPEVIRSERYGATADVYSFGVLMYCVLMGNDYPYQNQYLTPVQAARGVAKHGLRPNLSHVLTMGLRKIIEMCWASDATIRPSMDIVVHMVGSEEERAKQT